MALGFASGFPSDTRAAPSGAATDATQLPALLVEAGRGRRTGDSLPLAATVFDALTLEHTPATALDEVLRETAAFSLFRRSSSLSANPTAQGVSLRGIGPSGASRSLVLLDGIPLNDPFGGWVTWTKVPLLALARAEVVRGGGSALWGSGALGGTISLTSRPPSASPPLEIEADAGDFSTRSAAVAATALTPGGGIRFAAAGFRTTGFYGLPDASRGPVDRPLDLQHEVAQLTWQQSIGHGLTLGASGRLFTEDRGNGTVLQRNHTHDASDSVSIGGGRDAALLWHAVVYSEDERFRSYFSSVNATRSAETPANNQYDVPASAFGGAVTGEHRDANAATTFGADFRAVTGETREDFSYLSGRFTRRRFAGGTQTVGGGFIRHERTFSPEWQASLTLRYDQWENSAGHRREYDTSTGAPTRNDSYAPANGREFSPAAGLVYQPGRTWRFRGSVYRAFRLPTLNEYYRPFRVGPVNTEANPALAVENLIGAEIGCDWTFHALSLGATVFGNRLANAVGNITLSQTATATNRQRENIDSTRANGLELGAQWRITERFRLRGEYLLDQAYVEAARLQPSLVGRRLAEVPRQTFRVMLGCAAPAQLRLDLGVRYIGRQFDDDQNLLPLTAVTTVDAQISRPFGRHVEAYLTVQNLLDARVQTSRTADGLVTFDAPRTAHVGVRYHW